MSVRAGRTPLGAIRAEQWARLEPLLDAALELPPNGRSEYVASVKSTDATLGAALERCLEASDGDDTLLDRAEAARAALMAEQDRTPASDVELQSLLQNALGSVYVLERELSGAGMSRVFAADEPALGRKVVIKVVAPERLPGVSAERFGREIRLAAALQQANIVPVLTAGSAAGLPYFTMPFVDGHSLLERLEREGALPIGDAVSILRDVARALAYAHARSVVHRDIKPGNVLLSGGTAVVTDFGIAKALGEALSHTALANPGEVSTAIGTPGYMAPEQARGDADADHRVDIYAFGCLAYAVFTGKSPFSGRCPRRIIAAHLHETPPPLSALRPDVPPRIASLVARCVEKDPERRPHDASEILRTLDAETDRAAPRSSRRSSVRIIAAAASMVTVLSATGAYLSARRPVAESRGAALTFAVVPFRNVARDTALEYLADGIGDELLTSMGKLRGVRITGRTAAYRYKRRPDVNVETVQRELGARLLVTGTMQQRGGRLVVSVQLHDSVSHGELWSDTYDRAATDVGGVNNEIVRAITGELHRHFGDAVGAREATSFGTTNPTALNLYLIGNALVKRRGAGISLAVPYFERAIAADGGFARAYAALAMTLDYLPYFEGRRFGAVRPRVFSAARKALALDSTLAEAHVALGWMYGMSDRPDEAIAEFERAIALDPDDVNARVTYGRYLIHRLKLEEALVQFRRAQQSERVSALLSSWLGYTHFLLGQTDSAVVQSALAVQLDSTLLPVVNQGTSIHIALGHADAAHRLTRVIPPVGVMSHLPWVFAKLGDTATALRLVRAMEDARPRPWFAGAARASVLLAIGDTSAALTAYERAMREDEHWAIQYIMLPDPAYDPISGSARFGALVRQMGLDPLALARVRANARARAASLSAVRKF